MDANSKFHPEYRSSTASTSMNETELDFEPVVSGLSDAAAITTGQLITQKVGGENVYDVITASSSDSSDGSSNEFVKVEHSDAQQSGGSIGDSVSFKISQVHSDGDDKMNGTDGIFPIENIMEHEGEALDNTIHLFRDKLKETAGHAGEVAHEAVERAKHTASDVLPEIVRDVSNASQKTRGVGADVLHSLDESASSAMHSFKGEFDDAVHGILDATHHATDAFENTLQEANPPGDAFKGAAAQVHSAEGGLVDLKQEIKNTDLYARTEANDATKPANEDLIRLSDEINNASESDARHGAVFKQPLDGAHQDVRYPSQQWGLDWRQHANEGARIDALRSGFDVKADHPTDDGSAEESMLERKGPLTIPRQSPDDIIQLDRSFDWSKQSGFEVSPRPPTPPKELDDEDVKPTTIDLGQTGRLFVSGEHPSSILKNSTQGVKFNFKDMDARFLDIVYWRDPRKSGAVLGVTLFTLLVFAKFPLIAVLSYVGLSILGGTLGFRIYKLVEAQIKKTDGANPYQGYLEGRELHLPREKVHQQVDALIEHVQFIGDKMRRLFLVESIVESVKFGLLLWALTYVSCWFSGLSLLILALLALFTIPKVYEVYQEPIDRNVFIAKQHVDDINKMIGEKMPFLKKAAAATYNASHEKSY